jgi:hypothetical protein
MIELLVGFGGEQYHTIEHLGFWRKAKVCCEEKSWGEEGVRELLYTRYRSH